MFNQVKNVAAYTAVVSGMCTLGLSLMLAFYSLFVDLVPLNIDITTKIEQVFDIIFDSLGILAFFIRPNTLKVVCLLFTNYWLVRLSMKTTVVAIRMARALRDIIGSIASKLARFFLTIVGFRTL